jgi:hypothetical protein
MTNRAKMVAKQDIRLKAERDRWEASEVDRASVAAKTAEHTQEMIAAWNSMSDEQRKLWRADHYVPPSWFVRKMAEANAH